MLNIVIADENKAFVLSLTDYISTQEDLSIKGIAQDGREVMELLQSVKADVLILAIILPGIDGYEILKYIQNMPIEKKPIVIVTSLFEQEVYLKEAIKLGADFYIIKPVTNNMIVERIRFLFSNRKNVSNLQFKEASNFLCENLDVKKEITNLFHNLGIPANIKGHEYLREAVLMAYSDRECLNCITKNIYPDIAKRYGVNKGSVERAIRTALEISWIRGKSNCMANIFRYTINETKGKPTNAEFIAIIADKMKMDLSTKIK